MNTTDIETLYPLLEEYESEPGLAQDVLERAQGCLLGQLAGDSLGSLVEFRSEASIRESYPDGIRELADGGTHDTIAGQPTDDSEMALMLARSIIRAGRFDPGEAAVAYAHWFESPPFDYGGTTAQALRPAVAALRRGEGPASIAAAAQSAASRDSQANGALMRVSPLGILAHALPLAAAADLARQDAAITHPHPICQDANAAFVVAIAHAVATGSDAEQTYRFVSGWARGTSGAATDGASPVDPAVSECLELAATIPRRTSSVSRVGCSSLCATPSGSCFMPPVSRRAYATRSCAAGIRTRTRPSPEPYSERSTGSAPYLANGETPSCPVGPNGGGPVYIGPGRSLSGPWMRSSWRSGSLNSASRAARVPHDSQPPHVRPCLRTHNPDSRDECGCFTVRLYAHESG